MRVWSRIALVVVALLSTVAVSGDHYQGNCPLSLAGATPPATAFELSPHGVFRSGSLVYALRGQILTTYTTTNDVGDLVIAREDYIGSMAARESDGGVAYHEGFLYISSEAGLEIFDLRNVRVGGTAPILVSRTPGVHYRRLAVNGNRLAGLYPATDLPCYPIPNSTSCANSIDLFDITDMTSPVIIGSINSRAQARFRGFNDIAFNYGSLIAVGEQALLAFDITNPFSPTVFAERATPGKFLITNNADFLAVGNDQSIDIFSLRPGISPYFLRQRLLSMPQYLQIDRINAIRFNRGAYYDGTNGRLVTLVEEVDPMTLQAARTIAFDVFDLTVTHLEGSVERIYEDVTMTDEEEVKYNPVAVGPNIFVLGSRTGIQNWASCGIASGKIELDSPLHLTCGGAEIHGWVTGPAKIVNVELFLDSTALGAATFGDLYRHDVSSPTPVSLWRVNVNLDQTARGEYQLRAVATDALGNRRQFASRPLFFAGPGSNCMTPRRRAVR